MEGVEWMLEVIDEMDDYLLRLNNYKVPWENYERKLFEQRVIFKPMRALGKRLKEKLRSGK